jgi:glycosyltransferase involved in cell wall biosynthesis
VDVVHHGVDRQEFPPAADAGPDLGATCPARPPFFLCLGNTKPYKNIRSAIEAFALLASGDTTSRLVIAGRGDSRARLEAHAARLGVAERVQFTGPVPHASLLDLLHGAVALVFPSLVEGFGLPLVEAMSAGCPLIGSSAPAVAEVCGDSALLPDPRSPAEIAAAMRQMLDDRHLRDSLRARGLERAATFGWRTCAEKTLAVYRSVLEGSR